MKGVQLRAPGVVEVVDLPTPKPTPGEILVRVTHAGLCATDRRLAARWAGSPRVPGHEVAGYWGDIEVGVHPDVGCDKCPSCRTGFENRCGGRISIGVDRDGGLAEWVAVPTGHVMPLEGVPLEVAPLLEPLACCLHAVSLLEVEPGSAALVVGAGSMGILSTWSLQAGGARVAVAQRSSARRRLAAELGADVVLGTDDDPAQALGEPPEVAIVTAPNAQALTWALERVGAGGRVHVFASMPEGGAVDANVIHYRHLKLIGSTGSTMADYRRARELAINGTIKLDRLPVSWIALADVPRALLAYPDPLELKTLVTVGGEK